MSHSGSSLSTGAPEGSRPGGLPAGGSAAPRVAPAEDSGREGLPRTRSAEADIRLIVEKSGIFAFERFIDRLDFVRPSEHSRLKLAGGEIYDNLLRHAAPLADGAAHVRVARRGGRALYLIFCFKSLSFADYAARVRDYEPVFDHAARRWHGMGLRMTRNLSSSLRFRAGTLCDRIIIRF